MIVRGSKNLSTLPHHVSTNLAVVEVCPGESGEEAWRRYLADNPEDSRAHIKIFHYPEPSPLKLKKA
jgi:hypothetical protein